MQVIVNTPFEVEKKEIDLWEFLELVATQLDNIEDKAFGKILEQTEAENNEEVSREEFMAYIDNRLQWE